MNITRKIYQLGVQPQIDPHTNVVAFVQWGLSFSRNGHESVAMVATYLPLNDLSNFIPVQQLTKDQIIDWCVAVEGGEQFINNLTHIHERQLDVMERRAGVAKFDGPLQFTFDGLADGRIPFEDFS